MDNFWKSSLTPSSPLTLETLQKCADGIRLRPSAEPIHVIRGKNWCDRCGWRSLGMWRHGYPGEDA